MWWSGVEVSREVEWSCGGGESVGNERSGQGVWSVECQVSCQVKCHVKSSVMSRQVSCQVLEVGSCGSGVPKNSSQVTSRVSCQVSCQATNPHEGPSPCVQVWRRAPMGFLKSLEHILHVAWWLPWCALCMRGTLHQTLLLCPNLHHFAPLCPTWEHLGPIPTCPHSSPLPIGGPSKSLKVVGVHGARCCLLEVLAVHPFPPATHPRPPPKEIFSTTKVGKYVLMPCEVSPQTLVFVFFSKRVDPQTPAPLLGLCWRWGSNGPLPMAWRNKR